jgi:hypothetical protein
MSYQINYLKKYLIREIFYLDVGLGESEFKYYTWGK